VIPPSGKLKPCMQSRATEDNNETPFCIAVNKNWKLQICIQKWRFEQGQDFDTDDKTDENSEGGGSAENDCPAPMHVVVSADVVILYYHSLRTQECAREREDAPANYLEVMVEATAPAAAAVMKRDKPRDGDDDAPQVDPHPPKSKRRQ
jgi:hypothetical protein